MTIFIFVLFYNLLFFSGRGLTKLILQFFSLYRYNSDLQISKNISLKSLNALIYLFFFGNSMFILNFLIPIKYISSIFYAVTIIIFIFGLTKFKFNNLNFLISNLIFPSLIGISSFGIKFHYDSGAYHLGIQNWLYESKIIFGLINLNPFFSYASLNEYISAGLWSLNNYIFLHFTHLVFFVVFYNFINEIIIQNKSLFLKNTGIFILIYSLIDNFGINGGSNGYFQIQTIGKQDTGVGIIISIALIIFLNDVINSNYTKKGLTFLTLLSLFAFQLKINGGLLIILIFLYLFNFIKESKNIFYRENIMLSMILVGWLIKSFIISSCFIFPILSTCSKSVSWNAYKNVEAAKNGTIELNYAYVFGENIVDWFNEWLYIQFSYQIVLNFLFSFFFIFILRKLFFERKKLSINQIRAKYYGFVFLLVSFVTFFTTVPVYRNGYGVFVSIFTYLALNTGKFRYEDFVKPLVWSILLVLSLAAIPRDYMYKEFISSPTQIVTPEIKSVEYVKIDNSKWVNSNTGQCWISLYCISKNRVIFEDSLYTYKVFTSEKK